MSARDTFVATAAAVRTLLADERLRASWDEPSALAALTNGALAAHLARAALVVTPYLDGPPPEGPLADASEYFARLSPPPDHDDALNRGLRDRANDGAAGGPDAVLAAFDDALGALRERFATEPPDRTLRVAADIPMRLDDYLVTRVLEMVVHGDDLAVSIGAPPPEFPSAATGATIDCLVGVARIRHGDLAVVRALARRERDTPAALRVI